MHSLPRGVVFERDRSHQFIRVPGVPVRGILRRQRLNDLRPLHSRILLRGNRRERGVDVHQLQCGAVLDWRRDELVYRLRGLPDGQLRARGRGDEQRQLHRLPCGILLRHHSREQRVGVRELHRGAVLDGDRDGHLGQLHQLRGRTVLCDGGGDRGLRMRSLCRRAVLDGSGHGRRGQLHRLPHGGVLGHDRSQQRISVPAVPRRGIRGEQRLNCMCSLPGGGVLRRGRG